LFEEWVGKNPPLLELDLSRNTTLSTSALLAVLNHSGATLTHLNINGWKEVENDGLMQIGKLARDLRTIDLGWCREVSSLLPFYYVHTQVGF
jgi:DNA repair protein RAD7